MTTPNRPRPFARTDFPHFVTIVPRLQDNDIYGHINNTIYGAYFDTAVNQTLIEAGVLDMHHSAVIGLVVASHAAFFKPIAFPDTFTIGVRAARLGRSSVDYEFALFRGDETQASAQGGYTHVYIDRKSGRPVDLPAALRDVLQTLISN
jgi:acyl-CoA thioester hydrolase